MSLVITTIFLSKISVTADHLFEVLETSDSERKFIQFLSTYTQTIIGKLFSASYSQRKSQYFPFTDPSSILKGIVHRITLTSVFKEVHLLGIKLFNCPLFSD